MHISAPKSTTLIISLMFIVVVIGIKSSKIKVPAPNPCEGLANGTFVTNPAGCKYFFHCRDGHPVEAFCPSDMWFNSDSGICDVRLNVVCHLDNSKLPTDPRELILCPVKDNKEIKYIASTVDCKRYYVCYHGKPVQLECASDLHWNDAKKQCDLADNANCSVLSDTPRCPTIGQAFFPHETQCNYFVFCHNGFATIQQCPFYHFWDITANTCKWRNMARCGARNANKTSKKIKID